MKCFKCSLLLATLFLASSLNSQTPLENLARLPRTNQLINTDASSGSRVTIDEILFNAPFENTRIELVDVNGIVVFSGEFGEGIHTLEEASLVQGLYLVRFTNITTSEVEVDKVIIIHE